MPILLLILLAGVFAYFIWRHTTSSLTRNCRWRAERSKGQWRCTFCGAAASIGPNAAGGLSQVLILMEPILILNCTGASPDHRGQGLP